MKRRWTTTLINILTEDLDEGCLLITKRYGTGWSQQGHLATCLIAGCVGRGIRMGSQSWSTAGSRNLEKVSREPAELLDENPSQNNTTISMTDAVFLKMLVGA